MFYYILIFFTVFYHVCLSNCLEICFRSIPRWIALGAALESPLSGPAKRVAAFLVDGGEGHRQQNDGEGQIQGGKCPLILFVVGCLIFFFPAPFVGAQMVFSENLLTLGLCVRVWQPMILGFSQEHLKGVGSHTTSALAESCVALYLSWWWFDHLGGVSKIWEPGCFIETFKTTVFDCLIVCLPLLPGFEYYTLTLIKPPSQQYLAQDQHFLKLATSCQSATFA